LFADCPTYLGRAIFRKYITNGLSIANKIAPKSNTQMRFSHLFHLAHPKDVIMSNTKDHLKEEHIDFAIKRFVWHEGIDGPNQAPTARWLISELKKEFPAIKTIAGKGKEEEKALEVGLREKLAKKGEELDRVLETDD
jgi:hypothetical protein